MSNPTPFAYALTDDEVRAIVAGLHNRVTVLGRQAYHGRPDEARGYRAEQRTCLNLAHRLEQEAGI